MHCLAYLVSVCRAKDSEAGDGPQDADVLDELMADSFPVSAMDLISR
jgi:hypothetical protein